MKITTDTDVTKRLTDIAAWVMDEDVPPMVAELLDEINGAFTRSRWVSADDMVGIMEIAEFFEIGRSTVTGWAAQRFRTGMPEPVKKLGATPVYSLEEVVRWWVNWIPFKGAKAGTLPIGIDAEEYRMNQKEKE